MGRPLAMISTIATASALAMDAFSVSLGAGACRCSMPKTQVLYMALAFGLFQFAMPIGGWFLGDKIAHFISAWDHWIAALLLAVVGGKMIHQSIWPEENCDLLNVARPMVLLGLAVATSIDAMAVGFSSAAIGSPIIPLAISAGLITGVLSTIGAMAGCKIGLAVGHKAEFLGGVVLCLIGLNILRVHLFLS
ncbi:manganese efflux pump MntP [Dethiosulfovibrio salsuginis]|nr:manganese efflux pump MntP family protein [Dethiosulfovibrio salsuginis]